MLPLPPIYLSIVIPAYNEEARLPDTLERLAAYCTKFDFSWEIIAVVEKSTDRTVELSSVVAARHPEISVIVNQIQKGKGYAIRTGIGLSRGAIIFTMDADLSVPPEYIELFLLEFDRAPQIDVLVGNRRHEKSVIEVRQSRVREMLGSLFSFLVRRISRLELRDTQCGFKAMRHLAAVEVFSRQTIDGFACDVEALVLAERLGLAVQDLPVTWADSSDSRVRVIRDGLNMLFDLVRVRLRVARTLARRPAAPGDSASTLSQPRR